MTDKNYTSTKQITMYTLKRLAELWYGNTFTPKKKHEITCVLSKYLGLELVDIDFYCSTDKEVINRTERYNYDTEIVQETTVSITKYTFRGSVQGSMYLPISIAHQLDLYLEIESILNKPLENV